MTEEKAAVAVDKAGSRAPVKNLGWIVTFAGLGINLALGILYTWSVISKALPEGWSEGARSWPQTHVPPWVLQSAVSHTPRQTVLSGTGRRQPKKKTP